MRKKAQHDVGLFVWEIKGVNQWILFKSDNCNIFCNTREDKENMTRKINPKTVEKRLKIEII